MTVALAVALDRLEAAVVKAKRRGAAAQILDGLDRAADAATTLIQRELKAAWREIAADVAALAPIVPAEVALLQDRLEAIVRARLHPRTAKAFLQARHAAATFVGAAPPPVAKVWLDYLRTAVGTVDWFLLNPRMRDQANTQATKLADVETQDTVTTIRRQIVRSLEDGLPARESGYLLENVVGLNDRQAVALSRLTGRMIEAGLTGERLGKAIDRAAEKMRDYRALMIARTEGQAAANAGAFDTYQEADRQGLFGETLVKEWIAAEDACPVCDEVDGEQVELSADFELPTGDKLPHPPAHPNCRCKFGMAERR